MASLNRIFSMLTSPQGGGSAVGVDLGSSSLKVVEIEDRKGELALTTYGELQLGPYTDAPVGQSVTLDTQSEKQALVDVLREAGVQAERAVFAMPLASSFVTTIDFSTRPKEDLGARVRVEARKYIPAAISEMTLDWAELDSVSDDASERSVLLAAIQNDALARFRELMRFVKLPDPPTEIECFSTVRALYNDRESEVAVIDLGSVSSKLYVAKQGLVQRMHRVRAGGAICTKRIASVLEIDFEAAELKKRTVGSGASVPQELKRAHQASYDRAFHEFRQVITEYERAFGTELDAVYLTGGGSLFPGVANQLADELQREVRMADPFSKVAYPAFMEDTLQDIGPSFTVAIGAALRMFE